MVGLVGVVVVGSLAAVGGTAFWMWRKNRTGANELSRLPPNSFVVGRVDVDQILRFSPVAELRRTALHPGPNASARESELSRQWQDVIRRCTFDPSDRVHSVVFGADRTMLQGRSSSAWVATTQHNVAPAQATQCFTAVMELAHGTVATSAINGRSVLTPAFSGSTPSANDPSVHFLSGGSVIAARGYMPTALGFAYQEAPGLDLSSPLPRMMERLGGQRALTVAVDVGAIRAQNQRTVDEFADDLVRENPNSADLTLARQMQTGGLTIGLLNNGFELVARGEFASATVAGPFTTALRSTWTSRRAEVLSTIDQARQGTAALRMMAGLGGGADMGARIDRLEAAIGVGRAAVDQVRITQEDRAAVVSLTLTPAQVTVLVDAVRAARELASDVGNAIPGLGGAERRNEPQGPAVRLPGLTF